MKIIMGKFPERILITSHSSTVVCWKSLTLLLMLASTTDAPTVMEAFRAMMERGM